MARDLLTGPARRVALASVVVVALLIAASPLLRSKLATNRSFAARARTTRRRSAATSRPRIAVTASN